MHNASQRAEARFQREPNDALIAEATKLAREREECKREEEGGLSVGAATRIRRLINEARSRRLSIPLMGKTERDGIAQRAEYERQQEELARKYRLKLQQEADERRREQEQRYYGRYR